VESVSRIMESGEFDQLIGGIEHSGVEFKAAPYQVEHEHQKQELAKDVSALANGDGGVILLGVKTERDPVHFGDEIIEVHPFPRELVNPEQYQAIMGTWIYPALQQVEVQWFPGAGQPDKGLVAILVPKQPSARYPFLVTKTIDDKGKLTQILFGYIERRRANAVPTSIGEVHVLMRDGLRFDSLAEQLEDLRLLLEKQRLQQEQPAVPIEKVLSGRVERALTEVGLHDKPVFILSATPEQRVQIPSLFERKDAPIVRLLEKPPELRVSGFDLMAGSSARIVEGQFRRVMTPEYKLLELWRDGTLIFIGAGDDSVLGWGRTARRGQLIRINPLVLVESTYLFAELTRGVYENAEPRPSAIAYGLELRNMTVNDTPCGLIPGPLGTFAQMYGTDIHPAPSASTKIVVHWDGPGIPPGRIALLLLAELYVWFGIEHDKIPYTKKVGNLPEIDPVQIQDAGK
jgi:hypothetical protein